MHKLTTNILCGFVPNRQKRKKLRIRLNNAKLIRKCTDFVKTFSDKKHPNIKLQYGFRCANIVISIDDKYVFKFPIKDNGYDIANREKRITDALRKISPIHIPEMEIIDFDGMAVRKYEFINGVGFHGLDRKTQNEHADKIAKQLARFLYTVGTADPVTIRDLKPKKTLKPSIMFGWNQNDLWDNFLVDPKTSTVTGLIDWEAAGFNDFYNCFTGGTGNSAIKNALLCEYMELLKCK